MTRSRKPKAWLVTSRLPRSSMLARRWASMVFSVFCEAKVLIPATTSKVAVETTIQRRGHGANQFRPQARPHRGSYARSSDRTAEELEGVCNPPSARHSARILRPERRPDFSQAFRESAEGQWETPWLSADDADAFPDARAVLRRMNPEGEACSAKPS